VNNLVKNMDTNYRANSTILGAWYTTFTTRNIGVLAKIEASISNSMHKISKQKAEIVNILKQNTALYTR
jgi:hypothetical protein